MRNIVVVGGGVAAATAVETIRRRGYDGTLTLISAEDRLPYNRPPLSTDLLTGEVTEDQVALLADDAVDRLQLRLALGAPATGLDLAGRAVLVGERRFPFDAALLATGSTPRPLNLPPLDGVAHLASLADARQIKAAFANRPQVVVVGAGFIGCEVASSARARGLEVTMVDPFPLPLFQSLGSDLARDVAALHAAAGVTFLGGVSASAWLGSERVEGVQLSNGRRLPADLVVVGTGVLPVTRWLTGTGLDTSDGVRVDATLLAERGVYAAGDIARWPTPAGDYRRVAHWTNARGQAVRAATNLLTPDSARPYQRTPYVWSDQHGRHIQLAGTVTDAQEVKRVGPPNGDGTLALLRRENRLVGVFAIDKLAGFLKARRLLDHGASWAEAIVEDLTCDS